MLNALEVSKGSHTHTERRLLLWGLQDGCLLLRRLRPHFHPPPSRGTGTRKSYLPQFHDPRECFGRYLMNGAAAGMGTGQY